MKRSAMLEKLDAAGVHGGARTILLAAMDDAGTPWEAEEAQPEMAQRLQVRGSLEYRKNGVTVGYEPPALIHRDATPATRAEYDLAALAYNRRESVARVVRVLRPIGSARVTLSPGVAERWADLLEGNEDEE